MSIDIVSKQPRFPASVSRSCFLLPTRRKSYLCCVWGVSLWFMQQASGGHHVNPSPLHFQVLYVKLMLKNHVFHGYIALMSYLCSIKLKFNRLTVPRGTQNYCNMKIYSHMLLKNGKSARSVMSLRSFNELLAEYGAQPFDTWKALEHHLLKYFTFRFNPSTNVAYISLHNILDTLRLTDPRPFTNSCVIFHCYDN